MNTRLLKKIGKKVRIVKDGDQFDVQARTYIGLMKGWSEWESLNTFSTFKKAINKKNMQIILIVMRDMGCRCEFLHRRKERRQLKFGF